MILREKKSAFSQQCSHATSNVDEGEIVSEGSQQLHRKLRGKEIQLFAIGGAIGTSLFVQMSSALPKGGPGGLFLAFIIWSTVMAAVNECFAELACYMPIASPNIRLGASWVDSAFGFAMGWNYFLYVALLIPFEVVACNILLTYWTDKIPVVAVVIVITLLYGCLNLFSVRYFGITEFYLSFGKVFLLLGCIVFTFVTMVGGNPQHDAYGFRYWKEPGAFVEHLTPGNVGRGLGVLSCMVQASFTVAGPEYLSMTAGETERPRVILPSAFRAFVWRLLFFFCIGSLTMGIVIPYNDAQLVKFLSAGTGTGAASPYVIAMDRMNISGLPHLVNALILMSVFSAGNSDTFAAARALHGLALDGQAPHFLTKCTKAGVPIFAVAVALMFSLLGFLAIDSSSVEVLNYLVDLITACQLLNYFSTGITYVHFHASMRAQGVDRATLPYIGRFQPYTAYYAMAGTGVMMLALGYDLFISGGWSTLYFLLDYTMLATFPIAVVVWKIVKRTKYVGWGRADLQLGNTKAEIDAYEELYVPDKTSGVNRVLNKMFEN